MTTTTTGSKTAADRSLLLIRAFWLAFLCLMMVLPGALSGCAPRTDTVRVVANSGALTISNAETTALLLYEQEQLQAVAQVKQEGGTKDDATRAVAVIREKWTPHWELFRRAEHAHSALATAVEAYETGRAIVLADGRRVPTLADIASLSAAATKLYEELAALFNKKRAPIPTERTK